MKHGINPKTAVFLFLLLLIAGCDLDWQRYSNKDYKFSILLPGSWKIEEGVFNTVVMAMPPGKKEVVAFRENINVIVTELSEELKLSTFFELNKDQLQSKLAVNNEVSEGDIYAGWLAGKWLSFEQILQDIRLKTISAVWMKGRRIYTVTCTSQLKDFPKYKPIFDKVLRSLRVK